MSEISFAESLAGDPAPEVLDGRIWIDGCWDFFHHGHAGAMLQARKLGTELYVGVHSDDSILENKGPTVMTFKERIAAVNACRWVTRSIPDAPYVTTLPWISHYGCNYVVHGDDITSDSNGQDCYRYVKAAGRFKVVKRTPSISTTDLVGRMLLCTRTHFIKELDHLIKDEEEKSNLEVKKSNDGVEIKKLLQEYSTDETGLNPGSTVWYWKPSIKAQRDGSQLEKGTFTSLTQNIPPKPGQRIVYVDGGFDLFSSGHIEFFRLVVEEEAKIAQKMGWYRKDSVLKRIAKTGMDYAPYYIVAGVHDDEVINHWKGLNYPIMNILERGLCVLQCKYINSVLFGAPFIPSRVFLSMIPMGNPSAVYHGPTGFPSLNFDPYLAAKEMGIYREISHHDFSDVTASQICQRILKSRDVYEERQRIKNLKSINEDIARKNLSSGEN
ncbi:Ethanolamine-phosphate cytidylyltransferase [Golovinomyces cichoracearum]|uniref:ethanolamine-phosphate cytidylyltransferase n=1 Tax=Golovinomyces cichoracearum TaxID=62708 RepID=A0A420HP79_9PEZI|nr:Ethanolamine-phosphate cytidylyltransferase [Golovinomyces cichoracearum]